MPSAPLDAQLEALLFVASAPLSVEQLADTVGTSENDVQAGLKTLEQRLLTGGLRLSHIHDSYRLVTAPASANIIRQFLREETKSELTRPALETLAIIAYRGPLTKTAIEQLRGVASDTMLRNLLTRGLITEAGRSTETGRPLLYSVSHTFLQHFGLTSPADLPALTPDTPKPQKDQHAH